MIYRVYKIENGKKEEMSDWKSEVLARKCINIMYDEGSLYSETEYEYECISEAKKTKKGGK